MTPEEMGDPNGCGLGIEVDAQSPSTGLLAGSLESRSAGGTGPSLMIATIPTLAPRPGRPFDRRSRLQHGPPPSWEATL